VKLTKGLLRRNREDTAARLLLESELFTERLKSPEFMEAAMAFMEKRPPNFG
jgi:enoyl-CoA hydratase/carnithine racemase